MIKQNNQTINKEKNRDPLVDEIEQMINENAPQSLHAIEMSRQGNVRGVTFLEAQCLLSYVLSTCDWLQHPEQRGLGELVLEDVLKLNADSINQVLDDLETKFGTASPHGRPRPWRYSNRIICARLGAIGRSGV
jgi:hypothetical protein